MSCYITANAIVTQASWMLLPPSPLCLDGLYVSVSATAINTRHLVFSTLVGAELEHSLWRTVKYTVRD